MKQMTHIKKYVKRINVHCCGHRTNKNRYFFGYTGLKCCKQAMCLDCSNIQFVGGWFGRMIYPVIRAVMRNRFEVIKMIDIKPVFDEDWNKELERYGRDRQ